MHVFHEKPSIGNEFQLGGPQVQPSIEPALYLSVRGMIEKAAPEKSDLFHHMLTRDVIGATLDVGAIVDPERMVGMGRPESIAKLSDTFGKLQRQLGVEQAAHRLRDNIEAQASAKGRSNGIGPALVIAGVILVAVMIWIQHSPYQSCVRAASSGENSISLKEARIFCARG